MGDTVHRFELRQLLPQGTGKKDNQRHCFDFIFQVAQSFKSPHKEISVD